MEKFEDKGHSPPLSEDGPEEGEEEESFTDDEPMDDFGGSRPLGEGFEDPRYDGDAKKSGRKARRIAKSAVAVGNLTNPGEGTAASRCTVVPDDNDSGVSWNPGDDGDAPAMTAIGVVGIVAGGPGGHTNEEAAPVATTTAPTSTAVPKAVPTAAPTVAPSSSSRSSTWVDRVADMLRADEDSELSRRPEGMSRDELQAFRNYVEAKVLRIKSLEMTYNLAMHSAEYQYAGTIEEEINDIYDDLVKSNVDIQAIALIESGTTSIGDWMMSVLLRKL